MPCILYWRQEHFVVLHKINKNQYYIADPGYGKIKINKDTFIREWLHQNEYGVAIVVAPKEDFFKKEPQKCNRFITIKSITTFLKKKLAQYKSKLYTLSLLSCFIMLATWSIPFFYQQIIDQGIGDKSINKVLLFALLQLSFFIGCTLSNNVVNIILTKLGFNIGIELLTTYLKKLITLPISFFDVKLNTDLIQRIEDQNNIETFLTKTLNSSIFAFLNVIVYMCILGYYNSYVLLIFLLYACISIFYSLFFFKKRAIIDYSRFSANAENKNRIYELINGMADIKINGAQKVKVQQWLHTQEKINKITLKSLYINYYINSGNSFFDKLKDILIIIGCAFFVIEEKLTIGAMMTITYLLGQLSSSSLQLTTFFLNFQTTKLAYQRLDDIYTKEDENNDKKLLPPPQIKSITFNNVSFKYPGNINNFILNNINIVIPEGKVTAIVGSSGSGKTTLLKLLLAFYTPQKGTIYIDKEKMDTINTDEWRNHCGVVMQDGYIFSGSITENIALSDMEPDMIKIKQAAHISCIDNFIEQLPMKYNTKIGKSGINLSGGQKQRLLIARAIYKDPEFIFLDEATSSLDANNEYCIINNLQQFYKNKTVVIIAHRLSTVRNADNIIFLEKGEVIEQGNHTELSLKKGAYYNLVKNQLDLDT